MGINIRTNGRGTLSTIKKVLEAGSTDNSKTMGEGIKKCPFWKNNIKGHMARLHGWWSDIFKKILSPVKGIGGLFCHRKKTGPAVRRRSVLRSTVIGALLLLCSSFLTPISSVHGTNLEVVGTKVFKKGFFSSEEIPLTPESNIGDQNDIDMLRVHDGNMEVNNISLERMSLSGGDRGRSGVVAKDSISVKGKMTYGTDVSLTAGKDISAGFMECQHGNVSLTAGKDISMGIMYHYPHGNVSMTAGKDISMEALKGKGSERERTEIRMEAKNISVEKDIYHVNNIHLKADEKTGQISVGGNLMGDCSGGVVMVASKVSVDGNINERGARTGNITAANSISVKGDMNYQSNNVSLQAGEIFVGKDATFVNHDGEDTNIVVTNSISAKGSMKLAGDNASLKAKTVSVGKDMTFEGHSGGVDVVAEDLISADENMKLLGSRNTNGNVFLHAGKVFVGKDMTLEGRSGCVDVVAEDSISVKGNINLLSGKNTNDNASLKAKTVSVGKDMTFEGRSGCVDVVAKDLISADGNMKLLGGKNTNANVFLHAGKVSVGKDMTLEGRSGGVDVVAKDLISADGNMKLLGGKNTNGNVFLYAGKVFVGKDMTLEGRSGGVDVVAKDLISVEGNMKLLGGKNTNGNTSLIADFVFVDGNMTLEGRSGRASVVAEDSISVKGNMKLLGGNGNDGGVTLRSNTLVVGNMIGNANKKNTANITLTKRNGALNFDVKNLIVNENCHAKISLDGTEAWNRATGDSSTGVHFQKLTLRSGSTFDGIRTANNARHTSFNTYIFQGKDITFEGDFSGSGKLLNFQMPADIGNAPMVTVTGGAFLKGSRINVAIDGGTPILSEGSRIILMKANTMETQDIPLTSDASPDSLFTDGDGKRLSTGAATQGETKQDNVSTVDSIYNAATNVANSLKNTAGNAANGLKNFIGGNNGTSETGTGETETQPNGNNGTSANYANESLANYSNESLATGTDGTQSGTKQDNVSTVDILGTPGGNNGTSANYANESLANYSNESLITETDGTQSGTKQDTVSTVDSIYNAASNLANGLKNAASNVANSLKNFIGGNNGTSANYANESLATGTDGTQGETKQDTVSTVDILGTPGGNNGTSANYANESLANYSNESLATGTDGTQSGTKQDTVSTVDILGTPGGNNGTSANYANESLANYSNESLITGTDGTQSGTKQDTVSTVDILGTPGGNNGTSANYANESLITETDGTQSGTAQDHILSINNAGTSSGSKGPEITVMQGVTMQYPYSLSVDGGALSMEIAGNPTLAPHTKAFSEGAIAAVGAVNRAIDFVADAGIQNFMEQGRIFTAFSGGMSRYQSGSHVDANEFAALIGCGKRFETSMGKFTAATFCEGVFGNYKTHNTFAGIGDVTGGGDTKGFGGGIFYRFDLHGSEKGHLYGEGTAHVGKVSYNFGSSDIADAAGRKATYSSESTYYGFHGSVGYMGAISDNAHWDLYGKYFLTHKKGKDATLSTGEKISFKDANSQRAVAGLKLARFVGNTTKVYLGGAYSYEFAGKINAQIQSLDVEAPSLRGSTEILEVGIANRWNDNFIDLAIQGYVGKRSGVSATIYLEHSF